MRKRRNNLNSSLLIVLIAIISISIGYAAYSTILNITSIANINRSAFNIHFDTNSVDVLEGVDNGFNLVSLTDGPNFDLENKKLSFTTKLNLNEETKLTVDVINEGTINARVSGINLKVLGKEEFDDEYTTVADINTNRWSNEYLDFYVLWTDGNKNILDTVEIDSGTVKNMTIVIKYKEPSDYHDLPNVNKILKFEMDIDYIQANFRNQNEPINPLSSIGVSSATDIMNTLENNSNKDLILNLEDDIDLTSQTEIELTNNTTIELNGHTLEVAPNSIGVYSGATVIVEDTTGLGTMTSDRGLFNVYEGGKLVINSGNFNTTNNSRGSGIYMENGASLEVNGGTFNAAYYVIGSEGSVDVTVNGGTLESTSTSKSGSWAYAVKLDDGTFTMNGGTIIGVHGGLALDGNVSATINNGKIVVNESASGQNDGYYCMYVTETSTIDVYGGEFRNNGTRSVIYTTSSNYINLYDGKFIASGNTLFTGDNIKISGGSYSHNVSNYSENELQLDNESNMYVLP